MFHDFGWDEAMSTCHQREGVRTGRVPPSFPGLFTKSHWNMETFRQQYQQHLLPHHVEETHEVRISPSSQRPPHFAGSRPTKQT